jgi:hypothetical protein
MFQHSFTISPKALASDQIIAGLAYVKSIILERLDFTPSEPNGFVVSIEFRVKQNTDSSSGSTKT